MFGYFTFDRRHSSQRISILQEAQFLIFLALHNYSETNGNTFTRLGMRWCSSKTVQ